MKRILTLLSVLVLTLAMAAPAQSQSQSQSAPHFKFMGIPINGTITNFQSKLAAKGFTYDAKASKESGPGIRRFKGMFSGKKADLVVFFNTKTKVVFEVKVILDCYDDDAAANLYREMRSNLMTKYEGKSEYEDTIIDNEPGTNFYVFHNEKMVGVICVYVQTTRYGTTWVAIEYVDVVNSQKNNEGKMEDL